MNGEGQNPKKVRCHKASKREGFDGSFMVGKSCLISAWKGVKSILDQGMQFGDRAKFEKCSPRSMPTTLAPKDRSRTTIGENGSWTKIIILLS